MVWYTAATDASPRSAAGASGTACKRHQGLLAWGRLTARALLWLLQRVVPVKTYEPCEAIGHLVGAAFASWDKRPRGCKAGNRIFVLLWEAIASDD